jgi:hypothetical protein
MLVSIKPIDFQIVMPRTTEISKVANDEQHKGTLLQQQQAASTQNKAEASTKQVHTQENIQHAEIREKQQKEQGSRKEQDKKEEDAENTENKKQVKKTNPQIRTSTIDIRL